MPVRVFDKDEKEILRIKMLDSGFPLIKEYGVIHTSVARIAKAAGIDEKLKARDQMAWVGAMNAIRQQAEEIVMEELIYS